MRRWTFAALAIAAVGAVFTACSDDPPPGAAIPSLVDAGDGTTAPPADGSPTSDACAPPCTNADAAAARRLAIEVNPIDGALYAQKVDVAKAAGVSIVPTTLAWGYLLETSAPDAGTSQIVGGWFKVLSDVLAPRKLGLLLSVPLVDTVAIQAPPDLRPGLESGSLALDAPEVIARYERVIDAYLANSDPQLELAYLVVSNEADIWLSSRSDATWSALANFLTTVRDYVHVQRPNTKVGINVTFSGVADPIRAPKIAKLVASADVMFVSYYFGSNGFGGGVGTNLNNDLAAMLQSSVTKPLVLKEHGYATGVTGNSLAGQADFVSETMTFWDANASRIPLVVFSRMFDNQRANCEKEAVDYGFPGNEEFIQFLCTLGFQTVDGTPKPAWQRFVTSAAARDF